MINNYTAYTAKDLRVALGEARNLVPKENEDLRDKLHYIYQFITRLAWLGRAVDSFDEDYPLKDKEI